MKKIINGKVYDTSTAQMLGQDSYGNIPSDFSSWSETLYRKKTGEYFLYGEGGPMTKYATYTSANSWRGGERIMPLSYKEAADWAEDHLSGDSYEAIFGEIVEDDTKVNVAYKISVTAKEKVMRLADAAGVGIGEMLDRIILEHK